MFNEVIQAIKVSLYERIISPLLGAFVISWSIVNYRFYLIIFSNESVEEKFNLIHSYVFAEIWGYSLPYNLGILLFGILIPSAMTWAIIYIYPIPAKHVYEHTRKKQKELKTLRQEIDDEIPLTSKESRKIWATLAEKDEQLDSKIEEVRRVREENKRLREENEELFKSDLSSKDSLIEMRKLIEVEDDHQESDSQIEQSSATREGSLLGTDEESILKNIASSKEASYSGLWRGIEQDVSEIRFNHFLDKLISLGYISGGYSSNFQETAYKATVKGREYLVLNNLD